MARLDGRSVSTGRARTLPVATPEQQASATGAEHARQAAQKDVEAKLKAAFEQARTEGLSKGQAAASAEFQQRLEAAQQELERTRASMVEAETRRRQQFDAQIAAMRAHLQQQEQDAEQLAVELAFRALTRLLQVRSEDRTFLAEACQAALQELGSAVIRVRVPQAAAELVAMHAQSGVEIVVDGSLQPDQCFIETTRGEAESGLATRLEGLKNALLAAIEDGAGHRG